MSKFLSVVLVLPVLVACEGDDPPPNASPVVQTPDDVSIEVGETFEVLIEASDPDGDVLTFELSNGPEAASFTGRLLRWTPTEADIGVSAFEVSVSDDDVPPLTTIVAFDVTVEPPPEPNQAPVADELDDQTVTIGETLQLDLVASDPDGDALIWTSLTLPGSATLSPEGAFTFAPADGEEGVYELTFVVTDDGEPPLSDEISSSVEVVAAPTAYDIAGTALDAADLSVLPDLCVELVDVTPLVIGASTIVVDSTTTNSVGNFRFEGITGRPVGGFHLRLSDCNNTGAIALPSNTVVTNDQIANLADGDVLTTSALGMNGLLLGGIDNGADVAGFGGDLTQGNFMFGFVLDASGAPVSGASVNCSCSSARFYYLDADQLDGLFTTNGNVNTQTGSSGVVVVGDAELGLYDTTHGSLDFAGVFATGLPGEAVFVRLVEE